MVLYDGIHMIVTDLCDSMDRIGQICRNLERLILQTGLFRRDNLVNLNGACKMHSRMRKPHGFWTEFE